MFCCLPCCFFGWFLFFSSLSDDELDELESELDDELELLLELDDELELLELELDDEDEDDDESDV